MSRLSTLFLVLAAFTLAAPAAAADWQLVWSDEFDGTSLDLTKWEPQIGTGCPNLCGWGNNELQFYRAENATVADGMLTIEAREESWGGRDYTSARLRTLNQGDWLYGRFEMRAKLPKTKGLWPAFWMLPTNSSYGTWAASGEIDIIDAEKWGQAADIIGGYQQAGNADALVHGHIGDELVFITRGDNLDEAGAGEATTGAEGGRRIETEHLIPIPEILEGFPGQARLRFQIIMHAHQTAGAPGCCGCQGVFLDHH